MYGLGFRDHVQGLEFRCSWVADTRFREDRHGRGGSVQSCSTCEAQRLPKYVDREWV